jgi:hypothetical protein
MEVGMHVFFCWFQKIILILGHLIFSMFDLKSYAIVTLC